MENIIYGLMAKQDLRLGHGQFGPVTLPDGSSVMLDEIGLHTFIGSKVSVAAFEAAGDGIADDTTPIQNALDTGSSVLFPFGP